MYFYVIVRNLGHMCQENNVDDIKQNICIYYS